MKTARPFDSSHDGGNVSQAPLQQEPQFQAYTYRGPMPDCRTCSHYAANAQLACGICTNADRYDPLPPVRLWKTT
jgi:hypothetical protein